jgi:hypothetical protein
MVGKIKKDKLKLMNKKNSLVLQQQQVTEGTRIKFIKNNHDSW